ncbi:hypothetical protein ACIBH1_48165 [Nonomuraea sp. NPDC050663]|uniref:hypothetical protein n=1 Tax=Nonomuraea sp. NPDC050663 TaxID=3364370 RepID=UPI0037961583
MMDADERGPDLLRITEKTGLWRVCQSSSNPENNGDWGFDAEIDPTAPTGRDAWSVTSRTQQAVTTKACAGTDWQGRPGTRLFLQPRLAMV